ncbi:MAG: hypothetical protein MI921_16600 [Cytophagales bacterium]|nr:hypothetical protein [Cytophagales bacterium]
MIDYLIKEEGFNTIAFESGIYDLHIANKKLRKGLNVNAILSESIYTVWLGASLQPLVNVIDENREQIKLIGFDPEFSGINYGDIDLELYQLLNRGGITPDSSVMMAGQLIYVRCRNYLKTVLNLNFPVASTMRHWSI